MVAFPSLACQEIDFLSISISMRTERPVSILPTFDRVHLLLVATCPVLKLKVMQFFLLKDSYLSFSRMSSTPNHR